MIGRIAYPCLALTLGACVLPPSDAGDSLGTEASSTGGSAGTPGTTTSAESNSGPEQTGDSGGVDPETGSSSTGEPGCQGDPKCSNLLDVVIVVDNSGTMAEEQLALARSMPLLVEQLRSATTPEGQPLDLDVHMMVTTTDLGNPLCEPFTPPGYTPAAGSPITTSCTDRLDDFTNLGGTVMVPEACTNVCPQAVVPSGNFVSFGPLGSNVPAIPEVDINGDGSPDSPEAQALACIAPQGINGCGYESPLETMLQAINPNSEWNEGPDAFLREDANLAIVVISDEADCTSVPYGGTLIMLDPQHQNINPNSGFPEPSSATCWNAGVECEGPDAMGIYRSCSSVNVLGMHPVDRYTDYLDFLRSGLDKEVFMLELVGIPPVVAHEPAPPYTPVSGGVEDLVYRDWIDLPYPNGDIIPDEWNQGITAADKQFEFGIGPGCTGQDEAGEIYAQAIPPVRMLEVCQHLDQDATPAGTRCCMESICDGSYNPAATCLAGMIASNYSD